MAVSPTYELRKRFVALARQDVGKVESGRNQGEWIKKFWPATSYPNGYINREPYCAAAVAFYLKQWLQLKDVLDAFKFTPEQAEKWRCKSARAFGWLEWAQARGVKILLKDSILHVGDLVVYDYSHIEIVTDDDHTKNGPFVAIGFNTNAHASADGEGAFEKPRSRARVKSFIRLID